MTADPQQVMRILKVHGIELRIVDGTLRARCRHGAMSDEMASFVRYFKALILAEMEAERARREAA